MGPELHLPPPKLHSKDSKPSCQTQQLPHPKKSSAKTTAEVPPKHPPSAGCLSFFTPTKQKCTHLPHGRHSQHQREGSWHDYRGCFAPRVGSAQRCVHPQSHRGSSPPGTLAEVCQHSSNARVYGHSSAKGVIPHTPQFPGRQQKWEQWEVCSLQSSQAASQHEALCHGCISAQGGSPACATATLTQPQMHPHRAGQRAGPPWGAGVKQPLIR